MGRSKKRKKPQEGSVEWRRQNSLVSSVKVGDLIVLSDEFLGSDFKATFIRDHIGEIGVVTRVVCRGGRDEYDLHLTARFSFTVAEKKLFSGEFLRICGNE